MEANVKILNTWLIKDDTNINNINNPTDTIVSTTWWEVLKNLILPTTTKAILDILWLNKVLNPAQLIEELKDSRQEAANDENFELTA